MNKYAFDPARKHQPVAMTLRPDGRFPVKQGGRTGGTRRWNVWYWGYNCPTCGAFTSRPCNPFKGRKVPPPVCDGITYHAGRPVKRPAKLPPPADPTTGSAADPPPPATPGSTA